MVRGTHGIRPPEIRPHGRPPHQQPHLFHPLRAVRRVLHLVHEVHDALRRALLQTVRVARLLTQPVLDLLAPDLGFGERLVGVFFGGLEVVGRADVGKVIVIPFAWCDAFSLLTNGASDLRRGCGWWSICALLLSAHERLARVLAVRGFRTRVVCCRAITAVIVPTVDLGQLFAFAVALPFVLERRIRIHHVARCGTLPLVRVLFGSALAARRFTLAAVVFLRRHSCCPVTRISRLARG